MRTAFVFPGQGSLQPGTASAWSGHPAARVFDEVGAAAGLDLATLADAPESGARTAIAQPALFAASLAAYDALRAAGIIPDVVAGHSLGEVTAAVAAGVLDRQTGAELVAERGRAMADACRTTPGTMAAVVKLPCEVVERLAETLPDVHVANDNAPGQVVVAGPAAAVDALGERVRTEGGRMLTLKVEGAFHSPAMAPALVRVDQQLRRSRLTDASIPLVTGTTAKVLRDGSAVGRALVDGILAPVRWRAVQQQLADLGIDLIVEVGPGGVLRGLARRTVPDLHVLSVSGPADVDAVHEYADRASDRRLVATHSGGRP